MTSFHFKIVKTYDGFGYGYKQCLLEVDGCRHDNYSDDGREVCHGLSAKEYAKLGDYIHEKIEYMHDNFWSQPKPAKLYLSEVKEVLVGEASAKNIKDLIAKFKKSRIDETIAKNDNDLSNIASNSDDSSDIIKDSNDNSESDEDSDNDSNKDDNENNKDNDIDSKKIIK